MTTSKTCACASPTRPQQDVSRVVTLVHGTFAKHAPWIQDDQNLTTALATKVSNSVLDRFCWSGKNRHSSRLNAGDDLRQHLVELISSYNEVGASADHHVIAHSHGGNVALYALKERGDEDDAILADVKLITLATPFLFMRERIMHRWLFLILPICLLLSALLTFSPERDIFSIAVFICSLLGVVAYPLSAFLYWISRPTSRPKFMGLFTGKATRDESKRITAIQMEPPERLCIIRGMGDEASGSLGAAQLTSWILGKLVDLFSSWPSLLLRTAVIGFGIAVLMALIAGIFDVQFDSARVQAFQDKLGGEDFLFELLGFAILASVVIPLVAVPLIALFVSLSNLPFGVDALFWSYHAQTTAEASPRGASHVVVVGGRQLRYDKLSHGVYEDTDAIKIIVAQVDHAAQS